MGWWLGLAPATLEFWVRFQTRGTRENRATPCVKVPGIWHLLRDSAATHITCHVKSIAITANSQKVETPVCDSGSWVYPQVANLGNYFLILAHASWYSQAVKRSHCRRPAYHMSACTPLFSKFLSLSLPLGINPMRIHHFGRILNATVN